MSNRGSRDFRPARALGEANIPEAASRVDLNFFALAVAFLGDGQECLVEDVFMNLLIFAPPYTKCVCDI
jgi:hypothetical protein